MNVAGGGDLIQDIINIESFSEKKPENFNELGEVIIIFTDYIRNYVHNVRIFFYNKAFCDFYRIYFWYFSSIVSTKIK